MIHAPSLLRTPRYPDRIPLSTSFVIDPPSNCDAQLGLPSSVPPILTPSSLRTKSVSEVPSRK